MNAPLRPEGSRPRCVMIRHAAVATRYHGVCYGRSDVALSADGERHSQQLARALADDLALRGTVTRLVYSGKQRTQRLAECLSECLGIPAEKCDGLCERDFGCWELLSWDEIFRQHGEAMLGMLSHPDTYRPGGGETTMELRDRVLRWWEGLPRGEITVAVTHGGPIAALCGTRAGIPVERWPELIPACGDHVYFWE